MPTQLNCRMGVAALVVCVATCAPSNARGQATMWNFANDNLAAAYGPGVMDYFSITAELFTEFGTTTHFGIPNINGQEAHVMFYLPGSTPDETYTVTHNTPKTPTPAGSDTIFYGNQYTMIWDIYVPSATSTGWTSLYNTTAANANDGDLFLNPDRALGISGQYEGSAPYDQWHRIAVTLDALKEGPDMRKYIDGQFVGEFDTGGADNRWTLYTTDDDDPAADWFFILGDDNGDHEEGYLSMFFFVNQVLSDAQIAALGGPTAEGILSIPGGVILGDMNGDNAVNNLDIAPFSLALTDRTAYDAAFPGLYSLERADISKDGSFNNLDIAPFAALLTGGASQAVPEPATWCLLALGFLALAPRALRRKR